MMGPANIKMHSDEVSIPMLLCLTSDVLPAMPPAASLRLAPWCVDGC